MRSPYSEKPETIVPRSLAQLLADEVDERQGSTSRRRTRKTMSLRRVT
ncbi:hypothetical protein [Spirillospora sp. CA-294931]